MKTIVLTSILLLALVGCGQGQLAGSAFKDNGYQEDTVYISGNVFGLPADKTLKVAYDKFVEDEQVNLNITPDSEGNFVINSSGEHNSSSVNFENGTMSYKYSDEIISYYSKNANKGCLRLTHPF